MSLENELKVLKESNNELVQKVQYWKMTAAQRENENVELMREITDLRLKLSRLKNASDDEAHKLDSAVQRSSEEVLSHLVQASSAAARTMDLVKTYIHKRQELESTLPRWSTISEEQSTKKIHKVRPMVAGRSVHQPFVVLERSLVGNQTIERNDSQVPNVGDRAIPMQMLLDVYIPLRRIDAEGMPATPYEEEQDPNESSENLGLEGAEEDVADEFDNVTTEEGFEESRGLPAVSEESEGEAAQTPLRTQNEDPLEGPSWLLDRPSAKVRSRHNLEPDSTTGVGAASSPGLEMINEIRRQSASLSRGEAAGGESGACVYAHHVVSPGGASVFSPTVRRRRRSPPPPATPRTPHSPHHARRPSGGGVSGRVLKVLVPKIHLDRSPVSLTSPTLPLRRDHKRRAGDVTESPLKRPHLMRFDAPSPNGATDAKVIVLETKSQPEPGGSGVDSRQPGRDSQGVQSACRSRRESRSFSQVDRDSRSVTQVVMDSQSVSQIDRDNQSVSQVGRDDQSISQIDRESKPVSQQVSRVDRNSRESRDSRSASRSVRDSDSECEMLADRRPRRQKKAVVYKEKPLNRKMRR